MRKLIKNRDKAVGAAYYTYSKNINWGNSGRITSKNNAAQIDTALNRFIGSNGNIFYEISNHFDFVRKRGVNVPDSAASYFKQKIKANFESAKTKRSLKDTIIEELSNTAYGSATQKNFHRRTEEERLGDIKVGEGTKSRRVSTLFGEFSLVNTVPIDDQTTKYTYKSADGRATLTKISTTSPTFEESIEITVDDQLIYSDSNKIESAFPLMKNSKNKEIRYL